MQWEVHASVIEVLVPVLFCETFVFLFILNICKSYTLHRADYIMCSLLFADAPQTPRYFNEALRNRFLIRNRHVIPACWKSVFGCFCNACHITENRSVKVCLVAVFACSYRMLTCTTPRCVESRLISVSVMFRATLFLNVPYVANCKRISSGGVLAFSFYVGALAGIPLLSRFRYFLHFQNMTGKCFELLLHIYCVSNENKMIRMIIKPV